MARRPSGVVCLAWVAASCSGLTAQRGILPWTKDGRSLQVTQAVPGIIDGVSPGAPVPATHLRIADVDAELLRRLERAAFVVARFGMAAGQASAARSADQRAGVKWRARMLVPSVEEQLAGVAEATRGELGSRATPQVRDYVAAQVRAWLTTLDELLASLGEATLHDDQA